jgi:ADP-ribosylglycohydrolase
MNSPIDFSSAAAYDKVYGCWMGKNCGGTLGAPLEKGIGEPDPFDVWWYPKLQEGGIPNDDLEMQLVWLRAFEVQGRALDAHHLAQYWLNHIGYNWDEYGRARMNLRLGLHPPLSGSYDNWFKDCMGCPIRSEIFACVAPGLPRLAARYAYQDAIVDHADGESVYGELFNTAIQASAFLVSDLEELLDIGRTYVPDGTQTAKAIDAARCAFAAGLDWKSARRKVLEATPHYNSQYSPVNMGFQTIGLLYGRDFAESLCIAVNCGYDTDCTGATVGAILGILHGNSGLPAKWTEPLGDVIATNESWGGLRHCSDGPNPIPKDLGELTRRTLAVARVISAGYTPSRDALCADDEVRALWSLPSTRVSFALGTFKAEIEYGDSPVAVPGTSRQIQTILTNTTPFPASVRCGIATPRGWMAPAEQTLDIPAQGCGTVEWTLDIPAPSLLENSNTLFLQVSTPMQVAQLSAPIALVGSRRLRVSEPYALPGATRSDLLDHAFAPEKTAADLLRPGARPGVWSLHPVTGHDLELADRLPAGQVIYVQAFVESAAERNVILGLPTTGSVKSWVNARLVHRLLDVERFRPHTHKTQPYIEVTLQPGCNEIVAKFVRPADSPCFDAHLILADPADLNAGIVDLRWTRLPWEAADA